jgi:hypothetical protein
VLTEFDDADGELEGAIGDWLHFKEKGKRKKEKFLLILTNNIAKRQIYLHLIFSFFLSTFSLI